MKIGICTLTIAVVAIIWQLCYANCDKASKQQRSKRDDKYRTRIGKCRPPVSDEDLLSAIQKTGVLNNPSVKLVSLKGNLRFALLQSKTGTLTVLTGKKVKRNTDVCEEQGTLQFIQANEHFAYEIKSVECVGNPFCLAAKIYIDGNVGEMINGRCNLRKATITIIVAKDCQGTIAQTVEFGCSCKCVKA